MAVFAAAFLFGLVPWLGMLGLGAAHAEVSPGIPAVSFQGAFILTGLLYLVALVFALFTAAMVNATDTPGGDASEETTTGKTP